MPESWLFPSGNRPLSVASKPVWQVDAGSLASRTLPVTSPPPSGNDSVTSFTAYPEPFTTVPEALTASATLAPEPTASASTTTMVSSVDAASKHPRRRGPCGRILIHSSSTRGAISTRVDGPPAGRLRSALDGEHPAVGNSDDEIIEHDR